MAWAGVPWHDTREGSNDRIRRDDRFDFSERHEYDCILDHQGVGRSENGPALPLSPSHDHLDFCTKDHDYQQQEEQVIEHPRLQVISRRDYPAGFSFLNLVSERTIDTAPE